MPKVRKYRCARCGRTTISKAKRPKCPKTKPQCKGAMIEVGHSDHVQSTVNGNTLERIG